MIDLKVLCLGHISYDIIFPLKGFIEENKKIRIKEKIECGGGPASNAAYLLGKWGIETYIAGVVCNDLYGNEIKNEFEISNVNTKYLEIRNDLRHRKIKRNIIRFYIGDFITFFTSFKSNPQKSEICSGVLPELNIDNISSVLPLTAPASSPLS